MKLVFLNRFFFPDISATSQVLSDLAFHLAGPGREVHVITSRQRYDDAQAGLAAEETVRGVRVHRVWTSSFGRDALAGRALDYLSFYLTAAWKLAWLVGRGDVVVAKTDPPLISFPAAVVARLRGAHLVNWLQDVFPEIAERLGVRVPLPGLARALRSYSLRSAAVNVTLGQGMQEVVRKLVAGSDATVALIENWADGEAIRPVARVGNPLRSEWGLGERFVVAYSGNLGRAHEFETVLAACERLRDEGDFLFLFIGGGRQRPWLEAEARKRSLNNLRFQPYQPRERLALSLGVADVHLVTLNAQMEGLIVPSKFYGVAAAGRPTLFVGDPEGEIGRLLKKHKIGVSVRPGDVEGLVAALRALKGDQAGRVGMGLRARQIFESEWNKPLALARWSALIEAQASR